jgi:hypothetical protein
MRQINESQEQNHESEIASYIFTCLTLVSRELNYAI